MNIEDFNTYKNKRVFLTGHTGFKGSWLNLWLKYLGAEVLGYSLPPNTNPNHHTLLNPAKNDKFADILDIQTLSKTLIDFNPHIIFHLAAQPLVRESYEYPIETFQTNTIGTINILQVARKLDNLRAIVVITTDKVYENKEWIWGYRENDPLGGYDPYSASKACAEIATNAMKTSFFNLNDFNKTHQVLIATARAGNIIGGGDWSKDRLIPDLIRGIKANKSTIIRSPKATRPWQNVLDPLNGYLILGAKLMQGKKEFATNFNFGPNAEGNLNVESILNLAKKFWDKIDFKIKPQKNPLHEANLLMLDSTKAHTLLKWNPLYHSLTSLQITMEWYKAFCECNEILSQSQLQAYLNALKTSNGGGGLAKI